MKDLDIITIFDQVDVALDAFIAGAGRMAVIPGRNEITAIIDPDGPGIFRLIVPRSLIAFDDEAELERLAESLVGVNIEWDFCPAFMYVILHDDTRVQRAEERARALIREVIKQVRKEPDRFAVVRSLQEAIPLYPSDPVPGTPPYNRFVSA